MDDDTFMECIVTHEPLSEEEKARATDRRLAKPEDVHIFPRKDAVLDTEYINFKVKVTDDDNDLKKISQKLSEKWPNGLRKVS